MEMKQFILYKVSGVQGSIIRGDVHTFSIQDDCLIDEVEILQSNNSIDGVKIYLKGYITVDQTILSQITSKVQRFFVNLYLKVQPTVSKFNICIENIYNPNSPNKVSLLKSRVGLRASLTATSQCKVDSFKECFELKFSCSDVDDFYMLFYNIMKIDNIVVRFLMQYELLLSLVSSNHRQKEITKFISDCYNPANASDPIGFHQTTRPNKNYLEDDITYYRNLLGHNNGCEDVSDDIVIRFSDKLARVLLFALTSDQ